MECIKCGKQKSESEFYTAFPNKKGHCRECVEEAKKKVKKKIWEDHYKLDIN